MRSTSTTEEPPNRLPRWTLGDRLRKAREHRGWTQRELSSRLGVSLRTISRWERGENRPSYPLLVAASRETGVPIAWLVDEDGGDGS